MSLVPIAPSVTCETEQSYKETCMTCKSHDFMHPHFLPYKAENSTNCLLLTPTYPLQRHSSHHAFQMWHTSRMVSVVGAYVIKINIYKLIITSVHKKYALADNLTEADEHMKLS